MQPNMIDIRFNISINTFVSNKAVSLTAFLPFGFKISDVKYANNKLHKYFSHLNILKVKFTKDLNNSIIVTDNDNLYSNICSVEGHHIPYDYNFSIGRHGSKKFIMSLFELFTYLRPFIIHKPIDIDTLVSNITAINTIDCKKCSSYDNKGDLSLITKCFRRNYIIDQIKNHNLMTRLHKDDYIVSSISYNNKILYLCHD
jgi:hypothetical protein